MLNCCHYLVTRVDVAPSVRLKEFWVLELFHGPTFSLKDVALQFLGNLFEYFLKRGRKQRCLTILGATSGDTGSAAIHGLRGKKNINCFILFPHGKVTEIQERQMTTVLDKNVHCISIRVRRSVFLCFSTIFYDFLWRGAVLTESLCAVVCGVGRLRRRTGLGQRRLP